MPLYGQANIKEHPHPSRSQGRVWKASVAALIASSAADAWSSYRRPEANPLLRDATGRFSARGIGVKAAITGTSLAAQWMLVRKNPGAAGRAALTNFTMTGVFAGTAIYNHRLHRR